ncbi:MAG TPA: DUF433 domain-containing protein [Tepidiformaceae bacterium]|nr:DUF433 domain-containing protein [Tepidiformaceae bacterium]
MAALLAFTPDQVCRVTSLSRRQLRYWDATDFFRPRYSEGRARFARMYAFKDVVGLKTIAKLRDRLSLQELRRIGLWLNERYEQPWSELRFFIVGRQVVFEDQSGHRGLAGSPQGVLPIRLAEIEEETELAAATLLHRAPGQIGHIVRNRYVQHNAWIVDGTRIPTRAIWDFHEAGFSAADILREYPRLTGADVAAALRFEQQRCAKVG